MQIIFDEAGTNILNFTTFTPSIVYPMLKWILYVSLCLIWGSSFILMKEGLEAINPYHLALLRILSAGMIMIPLSFQAYKKVPRKMILPIVLSGFLGTFIPSFCFTLAQTKVDSSLAGIMNSLTPIFSVAIGVLFFQLRIGWVKWIGLLLGFAGMVTLVLGDNKAVQLDHIGYSLFIILATICYGLNVNVVTRFVKDAAPLHVAAIAFTSLVIPAIVLLGITGFFSAPELYNGIWSKGIFTASVLGIINTGLASVLFYLLVKRAGPVFASTVTYGIPFVAIGWGLAFNEQISLFQIAAMACILIGVRLANKD
jgi:drug/metabolite transporter (DMT)-like permease